MAKRARVSLCGAGLVLLLLSSAARDLRADPPPLSPSQWPPGRTIAAGVARPATGRLPFCSLTLPVCVHRAPGPDEAPLALAYLASAEQALTALRRVGLPLPRPDGRRGGSPGLDLYLWRAISASAASHYRIGIEPAESFPEDRSSVFALLSPSLPPGCARETAVHRSVALSMLAAVDGGETGGTLASAASFLAWETTGCAPLEAIDDAQQRPELPMIPATEPDDPRASPLLPYYLDAGFGAGAPGALFAAVFRASGQRTPALALRYTNVDLFRTMARLAKASGKTIADVLVDAAIARAFHGDREDGLHVPASAALGTFGRPRFDGVFAYEALPRRISFTPVYPTGITYSYVDLAGAPKGAGVIVSMAWEQPVTFRWAVVRVGRDGQELSRVDLTRERGVFDVQRTILQIDEAAALLVVGVSVGEVNPADPFKADEAPYEPHGGTVYVLRQDQVPP